MMSTEDKAAEALSIQELDAASKLGLSVITCRICSRPSLWMAGSKMPLQPMTCGRWACLLKWAEGTP